jgi:hypothetical protein
MVQHIGRPTRHRRPATFALVMATCLLGGLGASPLQAQQRPPPVPLPENPLPTLQRLANIEAALNEDHKRWVETHNNALGLSRDLEAARNRIAVLEGQRAALEGKLAALEASYKQHGHQLSVWGTGCIALPNVVQKDCVFVIGPNHPVLRATTRPVEIRSN